MSIAKTKRLGVTFYNPHKADDGYTLFCTPTGDVWLIDMEGYSVNHWRMPYVPGSHAILLPNGNLFYAGCLKGWQELGVPREAAGAGGIFMEVDWDRNLVWQAEVLYQFHDFHVMDNGHVIYPCWPPEGILPDELAIKVKGGQPGTEYNGKIFGDMLYEVDRDNNKLWKWVSYEHLDFEIDTICPLEHRKLWPYINSVWVCRDGNILLSTRYLSQVTKIEYPSGKVIGRYGKGRISHQHDCRELDNGNILIFDNGSHRHEYTPSYSRVVELDPARDEIVWEYKANPPTMFYSAICGGSERLPNGNTVICDSWRGRAFEVTYDGELVWEYLSPFVGYRLGIITNRIWRAHRYTRDYPGLKGKNLAPARFPWENKFFGPGAFIKD